MILTTIGEYRELLYFTTYVCIGEEKLVEIVTLFPKEVVTLDAFSPETKKLPAASLVIVLNPAPPPELVDEGTDTHCTVQLLLKT